MLPSCRSLLLVAVLLPLSRAWEPVVLSSQDAPPCPDGHVACQRPVLRLNGPPSIHLLNSDADYVDQGAHCTDTDGSDLSHAVQVEGDVVNARRSGACYTYRCMNAMGAGASPRSAVVVHRPHGDRAASRRRHARHGAYTFPCGSGWCRDLHFLHSGGRERGRGRAQRLRDAVRDAISSVLMCPSARSVPCGRAKQNVAGSHLWDARVLGIAARCGVRRGGWRGRSRMPPSRTTLRLSW